MLATEWEDPAENNNHVRRVRDGWIQVQKISDCCIHLCRLPPPILLTDYCFHRFRAPQSHVFIPSLERQMGTVSEVGTRAGSSCLSPSSLCFTYVPSFFPHRWQNVKTMNSIGSQQVPLGLGSQGNTRNPTCCLQQQEVAAECPLQICMFEERM